MAKIAHEVSFGVSAETTQATQALDALSAKLGKLGGDFSGSVLTNINTFNGALKSLSDTITGAGLGAAITDVSTSIKTFVKSLEKIGDLGAVTQVGTALGSLSTTLQDFSNGNTKFSSSVAKVTSALKNLAEGVKSTDFGAGITQIETQLSSLANVLSKFTAYSANTGATLKDTASGLRQFSSTLAKIDTNALTNSINALNSIDLSSFQNNLAYISVTSGTLARVASTLAPFSAAINTISSSLQRLSKSPTAITDLVAGINSLGASSATITGLSATLDPLAKSLAQVAMAISSFKSSGDNINKFTTGIASLVRSLATFSTAGTVLTDLAAAIDRLVTSINSLVGTNFRALLNDVVQSIRDLQATGARAAFVDLAAGINALSTNSARGQAALANYARVLNLIATATTAITATGGGLATFTAQAAGIQALGTAIAPNITLLTQYAQSFQRIARAQASLSATGASGIGSSATQLQLLASIAPTVAAPLSAISTSLGTFGAAANSAARSTRALVRALTDLQATGARLPSLFSSSGSSMGLFGSMLTVLGNSIRNQTSLISRLGSSLASLRSAAPVDIEKKINIGSSESKVAGLLGTIRNIAGAYVGVTALQALSKNIVDTGANFDNAMGSVKAVSRNAADYTEDSFKRMEREAFRLGRTTTYSATEAATALKELTQGGLTTQQAIESLGETMKLAELENMKVADAARITTSLMAQFQASASDLSEYVDKLAKTSAVTKTSVDQLKYALSYVGTAARSAGQPFGEVVAALGALSTAGVESSKAGTTLRDMLSDLVDTASYPMKKLQSLGFTVDDLNPRFNTLSSIIGKLKARGVDAADAMTIFGVRGGLAAGSLITVYDQYLQTLNEVQNQSKGTADIMQKDVTENLRKDLDRLSASWDFFLNKIFRSGFNDVMRSAVTSLKDFVVQAGFAVETLKNAFTGGQGMEILEAGMMVAFGNAANYLYSALQSGASIWLSYLTKRLSLVFDADFLKGLFEMGKGFGALLVSSAKSLAAQLLENNRTFAEDLLAKLLYIFDKVNDKFLSPLKSYISDRAASATSPIEYMGLQNKKNRLSTLYSDKKSSEESIITGIAALPAEYRVGPKGNQLTTEQSLEKIQNTSTQNLSLGLKFSLDQIKKTKKWSDQLSLDIEKTTKEINDQETKFGIRRTDNQETKSPEVYKEAAKMAIPDIVNAYKSEAKDAQADAEIILKNAFPQVGRKVKDNLIVPLMSELKAEFANFKPADLVDVSNFQTRLDELLKRYKPFESGEPPKTSGPVSGNTGIGEGVGEIKLSRGEGSGGSGMPATYNLTQLGGGFLGGFGLSMIDKDAAIKDNTAALRTLTSSLDNASGANRNKPAITANMVPAYTEAAKQTDLATWAATGKMPERLKAEMDRVNANQKAKEDAAAKQVADQQKATNERRISTQQQALKGAITSTLGTQFGLDVPYKLGIKNEAPIDANAAPIGAMDNQPLSLGTPYENALRAKTSDLGAPRRSTGELSNELFKQGMNLLEAKLESVSKDYESEFNKLTGKSLNQLEEVMRSAVYDTDINTVRLYSPNEEDYLGVNRSRLKTEVIDRLKRIIKPEQSMGNTEEVARNFVEKLNPYIESYIDTVSYLNNATGSNASLLEATPYLKGGAGLSTPQRLAPIKTATDVIERANLAPIAPEMGKEGYNSTRQNLLYGSPLGGLTPSMGTTTNLSSSSTPDVTLSQNSERQISKLDDIKSILASIDRKTKIPSSSTSGKLEITIT